RTHIAPMPVGPPSGPGMGADPTMPPGGPLPAGPRSHSASTPPGPPGLGMGYPVMNAELSAQIATGASVFPSEPVRTGSPHPAPSGYAMPAMSAMQPGPAMASGPLESMGPGMPLSTPQIGPGMPYGALP